MDPKGSSRVNHLQRNLGEVSIFAPDVAFLTKKENRIASLFLGDTTWIWLFGHFILPQNSSSWLTYDFCNLFTGAEVPCDWLMLGP